MKFPFDITIILIIIAILVIISLIFFFSNNSATKERLKILLERQDIFQKNIVDMLERGVNKIDDKFEKSSYNQNQNIQFI